MIWMQCFYVYSIFVIWQWFKSGMKIIQNAEKENQNAEFTNIQVVKSNVCFMLSALCFLPLYVLIAPLSFVGDYLRKTK